MKKILFFFFTISFFVEMKAQICFNPVNKIWSGGAFYYYNTLVSADFNNDGKADLAMGGVNLNIQVLLGTGSGNFGVPISTTSNNSFLLVTDDFNGDGKADLANYDGNTLYVLLGTGTGSFTPSSNTFVGGSSYYNKSVINADFNGDTHVDLAILTDSLVILLGTGTGGFSSISKFPTVSNPCSGVATDFNGDGKLDIATSSLYSNNLSILIGTGTGSFNAAIPISVGATSASIGSSDFNGDTYSDLAVEADSLTILLGNGLGGFNSINKYIGVNPDIVADFNGDGKMDLAGIETDNLMGNIPISVGTGTGSFGSTMLFATRTYTSTATYGDFNNDGQLDLAVAGGDSVRVDRLSVLLSCNISTYIKPNVDNKIFNVYPNPVVGSKINIDAEEITKSIVFDVYGKEVLESNKQTEIDVSNLSDGIYFIQVNAKNSISTQKIIIQH